ncbi:NAD(P)/FAD-dependent oxidoreductase, partial [Rhodopirellula europaea]
MSNASKQRPHVVVVGGGFAGLQVTRDLRKVDVSVTLLDRRNFHLFQPLLYQVATGELSPANIATPLRGILRKQKNARVVLEEVTSISLDSNEVYTTDSVIAFDYLVVATGAIHHYFGREEWRPLAPGLKTIENATEIRRQI